MLIGQNNTILLSDFGIARVVQAYSVGTAHITMPYRMLCNGIKQEGVQVSPDLASGFSVIHRYTTFGMASICPQSKGEEKPFSQVTNTH